jgi:hypothetical protein
MIEIADSRLEYTLEQHKVTFDIDGVKMDMDVTVCHGNVDNSIESSETNIWNTLTFEQKEDIESQLRDYFE